MINLYNYIHRFIGDPISTVLYMLILLKIALLDIVTQVDDLSLLSKMSSEQHLMGCYVRLKGAYCSFFTLQVIFESNF